jgi:FtsZ-binding cell division protein ZapB
MDALRILEEKLTALVALVQDLKGKNSALEEKVVATQQHSDELKKHNKQLEKEKNKLAEENFQLVADLGKLQASVSSGSEAIDLLKEEKALTKIAVDDLIKSISDLVATEQR